MTRAWRELAPQCSVLVRRSRIRNVRDWRSPSVPGPNGNACFGEGFRPSGRRSERVQNVNFEPRALDPQAGAPLSSAQLSVIVCRHAGAGFNPTGAPVGTRGSRPAALLNLQPLSAPNRVDGRDEPGHDTSICPIVCRFFRPPAFAPVDGRIGGVEAPGRYASPNVSRAASRSAFFSSSPRPRRRSSRKAPEGGGRLVPGGRRGRFIRSSRRLRIDSLSLAQRLYSER